MSESKNLDLYTIGNNIRDLRERKQLTQMKVVNDLGISYTHYAKIEEGMRSMSLKMLFMLVTYFNTDANTILGLDVKGGCLRWIQEEQSQEKKTDTGRNSLHNIFSLSITIANQLFKTYQAAINNK